MMMLQTLILLGLLTASDGFGSILSVSRTSSRLLQTLQYSKTPEFTVVDDEDDRPYAPPDFTIEDDYGDAASAPAVKKAYIPPDFTVEDDVPSAAPVKKSYAPPDFKVENDTSDSSYSESAAPTRVRRPKRKAVPSMKGTNWMQKNSEFANELPPKKVEEAPSRFDRRDSPQAGRGPHSRDGGRGGRGAPSRDGRGPPPGDFRENFRATRVFVQGIPPGTSWQDLKDHFKKAGDVVFASVSVDMDTGESRGHGIVQFEDPDMAQHAIKIMRDHPLNGSDLF
ncbi:MAG: hypothetical protein SGBAC_012419, partial [Bacillariaceae sp.]